MIDVVTIGETMVLMNPVENGSLKYVHQFTKSLAGAESNFAIGLARLGVRAGWISSLGKDSLGDYVESFIRGEGVDVSRVKRDDQHPTGLMFKERRGFGETRVYYYRHDSAASHMQTSDLDKDYIKQAKYLHLTGITPALSEFCRELVYEAIKIARSNGLTITFDPNLRLKLWPREVMKKVILDICGKVDIILPGVSEGEILLGTAEPEKMIKMFLDLGASTVLLKIGKEGAIVGTGEEIKHVPGYPVKKVVDPIGAGDGFAAGFVAARVKGYNLLESVRLANAVGAFALTVKGDVEGLPTWEELQVFLGQREEIDR